MGIKLETLALILCYRNNLTQKLKLRDKNPTIVLKINLDNYM